jgi:hypothetical protein
VATAVLLVVIAGGGSLDGIVLLAIVDLILFAMLVIEHLRVEVRYRTPAAG